MGVMEYLLGASWVWFMGFFPLFEIYVAVPAGMATGIGAVSVLLWAIAGNFAPILLIHFAYDRLLGMGRFGRWLQGLASEKMQARLNRWGPLFVFLATPITGVWVMSVTAKVLRMNSQKFLLYSFLSITAYGLILIALIQFGVSVVSAS